MMLPLIVLATLLRLAWSEDSSELDWESGGMGAEERQAAAAELYKRLYNFGLGKRAYSYVSEYKRLPVYNFGLGKRSPRHYNFGLGKRADTYDEVPHFTTGLSVRPKMEHDKGRDDSYLPSDYVKRIRPYNFGLGKRAPRQYNFGLGKRNKLYSFGLGKRSEDYDEDGEELYTLPLRPERSLHYNFGLGKREESPSPIKNLAGLPTNKETSQ